MNWRAFKVCVSLTQAAVLAAVTRKPFAEDGEGGRAQEHSPGIIGGGRYLPVTGTLSIPSPIGLRPDQGPGAGGGKKNPAGRRASCRAGERGAIRRPLEGPHAATRQKGHFPAGPLHGHDKTLAPGDLPDRGGHAFVTLAA